MVGYWSHPFALHLFVLLSCYALFHLESFFVFTIGGPDFYGIQAHKISTTFVGLWKHRGAYLCCCSIRAWCVFISSEESLAVNDYPKCSLWLQNITRFQIDNNHFKWNSLQSCFGKLEVVCIGRTNSLRSYVFERWSVSNLDARGHHIQTSS